jgi:hypothetical protein
MWNWLKQAVSKTWKWIASQFIEVKTCLHGMGNRKPTPNEMKFVMRLPGNIIGGVITGFFFMAAATNSVAALPLGIILIFGALLVYKWGTQDAGEAD